MKTMKRLTEHIEGEELPPVVVRCGGNEHTISFDPETGEWKFHDHNVVAAGVVAALGGLSNACSVMRDDIEERAGVEGMKVADVYEWVACGFSLTQMRAWRPAGSPRQAARWVRAGVKRPGDVRQFVGLGVTDPDEAALWVRATRYGRKHDMAFVREFITHGVSSASEALAWREAGLTGPNLLPRYIKRGWTPEKFARRKEQERVA